jgi:hypothetical protein
MTKEIRRRGFASFRNRNVKEEPSAFEPGSEGVQRIQPLGR